MAVGVTLSLRSVERISVNYPLIGVNLSLRSGSK
jgi:hypothetical protein